MGLKGFYRRHENKILASVLLLALLLVVGIRYDYYYDLNDDVTMKDTLSGVYTGTPEGHNIQMLYPLSLAISMGYRIFPEAPVYGVFLCFCQYGCIWLIAERSFGVGRDTWQKTGMALAEGMILFALLLPHLVFVQYTFVSAALAATAAFLFITSRDGEPGDFFLRNLLCILLAVLAYMLRTEMLLLLLPLICAAGMYRWSLEKQIFTKGNAVKYLAVIGGILVGMAAAWGINAAAFGSQEWKSYVDFFNSRTELYDFYGIPSYEGNEELYRELGLTENAQEMLLEQYNFGLEDTLDAGILERISEQQAAAKGEGQFWPSLLREKLKWYVYRSIHKTPDDFPWNYCVIFCYLSVFLAMLAGAVKRNGIRGITEDEGRQNVFQGIAEAMEEQNGFQGMAKKKYFREIAAGIGKLLLLFCVRTALWMYILIRGRDPVRITHSLYWMEICILAAMFCVEMIAGMGREAECHKREQAGKNVIGRVAITIGKKTVRKLEKRQGKGCCIVLFLLAIVLGGIGASKCVAATDKEYQARAVADAVDGGMKRYSREHPGNFYFFDVYSAVSYPLEPYQSTPYSEKMFADVDNQLGNYDIMGGWLVKSPTYQKKLEAFGMASMREALLYQENVYMMAELQKGTEAFASYFKEQGADVELELVDTVCGLIGVYKVRIS